MSVAIPLFTNEEVKENRDKFSFIDEFDGIPCSVKKFKKDAPLMRYLDEGSSAIGQVGKTAKASFSGTPLRYSIYNPTQAVWILKYYTNKNDLILDPFMGRGTRSQMSLYLERKYVGYDVCDDTVNLNHVLSERNGFNKEDYTFIKGDGVAMDDYKENNNCFDAVFTCPPYYNIEKYSGVDGDISFLNDKGFEDSIGHLFKNLYRLIKPSYYDRNEFHPVIITVGSKRIGPGGLLDMDFLFQNKAKKEGFILHDKLITENISSIGAFTFRRNYIKKFVHKTHETTLVFLK